jgi:UDP-N-acetylmuramate dehydrogenase
MREAADAGLPILVLGGGSNLLPADGGFGGLVARYTAAEFTVERTVDGDDSVVATGGVTIANLARRLARQGWSGLEWAANVPGTVGGAAVNNAGAFGSCMAESLIELTLLDLDGGEWTLSCAELEYAYRSSRLKHSERGTVLVSVVRCRLRADDPAATTARVAEFQRQRTASQPRQLSAGSVFANPPGDFAGRLIEQAGLKGARRGDAEISRQHANFIVNLGHATAADVYGLMRFAQDAVWDRAGVWLHPEIQLVGAWDDGQVERLRGPAGVGFEG